MDGPLAVTLHQHGAAHHITSADRMTVGLRSTTAFSKTTYARGMHRSRSRTRCIAARAFAVHAPEEGLEWVKTRTSLLGSCVRFGRVQTSPARGSLGQPMPICLATSLLRDGALLPRA